MSKLEPTRTYSNHTATERIRAMLDERGVEWEDMSIRPYACTSWRDPDGEPCTALEGADDIPDGKLSVQALLPPEQAIAATLGATPTPPPPTMPEQPPYDLLIDLLRDDWDIDVSWDGLRRFWYVGLTDEGVRKRDEREAATLGRGMLTADDVRDLIERHSDATGGNGRDFHNGAYVSIADELNATLGSCNCTDDCTDSERTETCEMEYVSDWMSWHCKSCDHMDMAPRNPKPRYCKWCGRRIEQ